MLKMWRIALLSAIVNELFIVQVYTCNEVVCGSIVSKCLLTKSCECDSKNNICRKNCLKCLSYLFDECCSCVDLCADSQVLEKSYVGDLRELVPHLFQVIIEVEDPQKRWKTITFQNDYGSKSKRRNFNKSAKQKIAPIKANCTVVFLTRSMTHLKCRTMCQNMGAYRYRWFHDGCCECIDKNCSNYGINKSRCREFFSEEDDYELDYDYNQDDF